MAWPTSRRPFPARGTRSRTLGCSSLIGGTFYPADVLKIETLKECLLLEKGYEEELQAATDAAWECVSPPQLTKTPKNNLIKLVNRCDYYDLKLPTHDNHHGG
jgi:hypothetical protein